LPLQILLADDHQMVREGLKMLLERAGFKVGEASDARRPSGGSAIWFPTWPCSISPCRG